MTRCPACRHENPDDYRFCGGCGRARIDPLVHVADRPAAEQLIDGAPPPQRSQQWSPPPEGAPTRRGTSDSTRYLCSAMYLDSRHSATVVRDVIDADHRAVASSPGVDMACVARHALAARRRQLGRDIALTALVLLFLISLYHQSGTLFLLSLLAAWAVAAGDLLISRYGIIAQRLSRTAFSTDGAPEPIDPRRRRRVREIAERDGGNVIVHSGYSPFVGCGFPLGGWSFALDVTKPAEGCDAPLPFTVIELCEHVTRSLQGLRWPALRIEPKVIVSGQDIRHDARFLPDPLAPPISWADPALHDGLLVGQEDRVRPYLHVQVTGWRDELVLSHFLRFLLLPSSLFVEGSYSLLTPVQQRYQEADRLLPQPTTGQFFRLIWQAAKALLGLLVRAPFHVLAAAVAPVRRAWRTTAERREIAADLSFDYGASLSVRELVSDRSFRRYFQRLDKELYVKVVEERVLDAIIDFLEARDIDAGELQQRSNTILNNGVMVSGSGQLHTGNLAVGEGATAGTTITRGQRAASAGGTTTGRGERA
ncbi:MAG: zinc ribbon domain-containing protein [Frankiaceae bacterium]